MLLPLVAPNDIAGGSVFVVAVAVVVLVEVAVLHS